jgi:hypothetical protein
MYKLTKDNVDVFESRELRTAQLALFLIRELKPDHVWELVVGPDTEAKPIVTMPQLYNVGAIAVHGDDKSVQVYFPWIPDKNTCNVIRMYGFRWNKAGKHWGIQLDPPYIDMNHDVLKTALSKAKQRS